MSETINIGSLANKTGVLASTIRFYERKGLLPEPMRSKSGYRTYSQETINTLLFIKNAQQLEFTLKEISLFLNWSQSKNNHFEHAFTRVKNKILSIQKKIEILENANQRLEQLTHYCPIFKHGGNCTTNECKTKKCLLIKKTYSISPINTIDTTIKIKNKKHKLALLKSENHLKPHFKSENISTITKQLEKKSAMLNEMQNKYDVFFNNFPGILYIQDGRTMKISQCNNNTMEILGYSLSQLQEFSLHELVDSSFHQVLDQALLDLRTNELVDNLKIAFVNSEGQSLPVCVHIKGVRNSKGDLLYTITSGQFSKIHQLKNPQFSQMYLLSKTVDDFRGSLINTMQASISITIENSKSLLEELLFEKLKPNHRVKIEEILHSTESIIEILKSSK
jgi:MerR family transcriptional regulator, mercuric resistance operon regulatory protein